MSLDSLAPDQRAVVQLVLQQDRSYDDLATLLGVTPDAVRARAHRGLERLAPADGLDADARAEISDYLLGQQSESGREATRDLLQRSEAGRGWALALTDELSGVARSPLPEVPAGDFAEPETVADEPEPAATAAPGRARPRPRRAAAPVPDFGFDEPDEDRGRRVSGATATGGGHRVSRLGGALLLAGLAIGLTALVIALVSGDDGGRQAEAEATPTATATGTATAAADGDYTPIGYLNLRAANDSASRGRFIVYASQNRQIAFNVLASKVPATPEGSAYGVWLTGGGQPRFLGFAPPVGEDGQLRVSGPRQGDQKDFAGWFTRAKQIVVSRETQEGATAPGPLLLSGTVKALKAAPTATATP